MAKKASLPAIVSALPNDVRNFLQRVREMMDGFVTTDALVSSGIVTVTDGGNVVSPEFDFTPPPAHTGLVATGTITSIMLSWDSAESYSNYAYTEIWRSGEDNIGTAVLSGQQNFNFYVDTVDPSSSYYYWIRIVSRAKVLGPFNALAGMHGTTSADPSAVLDLLSGAITTSELHGALETKISLIDAADTVSGSVAARIKAEADARASQTGDLYAQYTVKLDVGGAVSGYGLASTGPTGTGSVFEVRADKIAFAAPYGVSGASCVPFVVDTISNRVAMDGAYMKTATIGTAAIGDLAVTDAKMVSLQVGKITSGDFTGKYINLGTGGNIRSGQTAFNTGSGFWLGKGTDGYARFSVGSATDNGFDWDQSTGIMRFRGIMSLTAGTTGYSNLSDRPTSLSAVNASEGKKLAGIAAGATVGATWGANITGQPTNYNIVNDVDLASLINSKTTTINGGKITAGSIYSGQIAASSITGDRLAARTIYGDRIQAKSITANEIAAGAIYAGSGVIGALAVDTLQIAGRAVTVPSTVVSASNLYLTAGAYTTVQSIVVYPIGGEPLLILANAVIGAHFSSDGSSEIYFAIYYNSTLIFNAIVGMTPTVGSGDPPAVCANTASFVYTPPAGEATISLQVLGGYVAKTRSITTLEIKR